MPELQAEALSTPAAEQASIPVAAVPSALSAMSDSHSCFSAALLQSGLQARRYAAY